MQVLLANACPCSSTSSFFSLVFFHPCKYRLKLVGNKYYFYYYSGSHSKPPNHHFTLGTGLRKFDGGISRSLAPILNPLIITLHWVSDIGNLMGVIPEVRHPEFPKCVTHSKVPNHHLHWVWDFENSMGVISEVRHPF